MAPTLSRKRKSRQSSLISRKKPRKEVKTLEQLPWKSIQRTFDSGADGDDGILEFEEVDDVEVIYEETESGRVAKFHVRSHLLPSSSLTDIYRFRKKMQPMMIRNPLRINPRRRLGIMLTIKMSSQMNHLNLTVMPDFVAESSLFQCS
jgi:hypothetical protein